ncbi:MAG: Nif3-like dinuclear metal center hexameric protein [Ignavibacteriae bacterium]|nr:Nif3-like dinuclear metal center hexameric protein [Ignavibacteriota bacterium]
MVVQDVQHILDAWAPKDIAWNRDNVGLQIGSSQKTVRKILVVLDLTDEVIKEARRKKVDLIVSHHPLLFHPIKTITHDGRVGRLIQKLIESGIALFSAHTNLDFTRHGVSFTLAEKLGLYKIDFLHKSYKNQKKIVVFVPRAHVDRVTEAMAVAGAGRIGKYELCSFRAEGTGTFKPLEGAKPFSGKIGNLEKVPEIRLEMIVQASKAHDVINAMRSSHPYEEVAYDVYDLDNTSYDYGEGAIGEFKTRMPAKRFLEHICRTLRTRTVRYIGNTKQRILRVAVCGGSGSELLPIAIQQGADALITADIKYHTFQETDLKIMLVDAGHFETEQPVVQKIVEYLKRQFLIQKKHIKVFPSRSSYNPVQYFVL